LARSAIKVAITVSIQDEEIPQSRWAVLLKHFSELGGDR
jgi:hypothetical protein